MSVIASGCVGDNVPSTLIISSFCSKCGKKIETKIVNPPEMICGFPVRLICDDCVGKQNLGPFVLKDYL